MIEKLTKSAGYVLEDVYKQMDEIVKQIPNKYSIAYSQFKLEEPECIDDSSILGIAFWLNDSYKLAYDEWSFLCAYKEVFKASMNDGVQLKMISVVLHKQSDNSWKKVLKFQTVEQYNNLENSLVKIDNEIKSHLLEEMVKRKINWDHTSYDAVAENSFKSFTYSKELITEKPTETMEILKKKAIEIYHSFNFELEALSWTLSHNAKPENFYRLDYYI